MMNETKTIWHLGGWNRNYGDHVLQASIKENLMKVSDYPLNFIHVDYQNTHFFPELIDRVNNEADLILIGGGGAIFNRPEDKSLSGWQFSIKTEDIEKLEVPIVIYSVGYNKFNYDENGFREGINENLKLVQKKSKLFSVRNTGTKKELISRGLDSDKIEVIPDAGSFLEPKKIKIPGLDNSKLKIAVNFVSDRPSYTFPNPYQETKNEIVDNLISSFEFFIKNNNAQIICIEHIKDLDLEITDYMKEKIGNNFISIQENMPYIYPSSYIFAPFLMDIYRQMDLVIGMRGHANIIPFGMGTPFIALSSHNKNRFFLEEINEEEYLLDIRNYKDGCSIDNIISKIQKLLKEKDKYCQRNRIKFNKMKSLYDDFNKRVIQAI